MAVIPDSREAETSRLQVQGQPQQLSGTLSNLVKPCLKNKNKNKKGLRMWLSGLGPLGSIPGAKNK